MLPACSRPLPRAASAWAEPALRGRGTRVEARPGASHAADDFARGLLEQEARALLTRVEKLQPYALSMPMVTAAAISPAAQVGVETLLHRGKAELSAITLGYLDWIRGEGRAAPPREAQRRFNTLRLRFNAVIRQFDIFANVLSQRSEHDTGVWVAGLDDVAADALEIPGNYYTSPPIICYLDRNHGAAIRRAKTRLPGGKENPVAVISIPRERMIGSGIASSLVHEVGHQAAALLGLVSSLRMALAARAAEDPERARAWRLYGRWISEIVADLWSVGRIGVAGTIGLIAVVSLPRPFVFRMEPTDPHPIPWFRVKISCALGRAFYPHPQWDALARIWESLYPLDGLEPGFRSLLDELQDALPDFVDLLLGHRPKSLRGRTLGRAVYRRSMHPERLAARFARWRKDPDAMRRSRPSLVFAVLGQAKADGALGPEAEGRALSEMLTYWALTSSMGRQARCAGIPRTLNPNRTLSP